MPDDAAVYRISEDKALVLTVDYFTPIVDDPYAFGQIAAANAMSDVYAMGGVPLVALNIVGFPADSPDLPLSVLTEILRGGAEKAAEVGVSVVGGHTIDDREPKYGMAITGLVHPNKIVTSSGAKPGDRLILTKPIGTGVIATAIKRARAGEDLIERAIATMSSLNRGASLAMLEVGVHACTDVTGFGLLGHLRAMVAASEVAARIRLRDIPVIDGVWDLLDDDLAPGGTYRNLDALGESVVWPGSVREVDRLMLCDPQTSGGLLVAVSPGQVSRLLAAFEKVGTLAAADIGEVVEGSGVIFVE